MKNLNIVKLTEEISKIVNNNDIVSEDAAILAREHGIDSPALIKKYLQSIEDENRLLQIGIVGRVKAGKSSLLNALLFDGKAILPKAATPMTAALTMIEYAEKPSAEIEFFSATDKDNIKENYEEYRNILKRKTDTKEEKLKSEKINKGKSAKIKPGELRKKAGKQAKVEMREHSELSAAYDQYQKMINSGISIDSVENAKKLEFSNMDELSSRLLDFVGADGQYMPFTKSVTIELPDENLKNIRIVDTPGMNDPVQSREERTRELLKYCDVVFILSPSGHFFSSEDLTLMDRITTKEGIRELHVIASQIDTQLFGSEKRSNLQQVLSNLTSHLGDLLSSTLIQLKKNNPEVGTAFDQLIAQGKDNVIYSSGLCHTIKIHFDERNNWDDGVQKVWENLCLNYPDYFSDDDKNISVQSLALLANISAVQNIIDEVREKKDGILENRKAEFIQAKYNSLTKYKKDLLSYANEQMTRINETNIKEIKQQKSKLKKIQRTASLSVNEEYFSLVEDLQLNIKNKLTSTLKSYFNATKQSVNESEVTKQQKYIKDKGWWRGLFGQRYEERTRTVTTVRPGAVRSIIEEFTLDIENIISNQTQAFIGDWKKKLYSHIVKTLRDKVDDDDLDPQLLRSTIRKVINTVDYPDIEYGGQLPDNFKRTKILKGSRAKEYNQAAQDYLLTLKRRVNQDIKNYLNSLTHKLEDVDISLQIFGNYNERIEQLEEQIKSKKKTLNKFNHFIKELEGV